MSEKPLQTCIFSQKDGCLDSKTQRTDKYSAKREGSVDKQGKEKGLCI